MGALAHGKICVIVISRVALAGCTRLGVSTLAQRAVVCEANDQFAHTYGCADDVSRASLTVRSIGVGADA